MFTHSARAVLPVVVASAALAAWALFAALPVTAADAARGRALYESRCDTCHTASVHVRASRRASDFAGIRLQVERWNGQLGGAWRQEDIDDVTVYLNDRFYQYPCPDKLCGAGAARSGGGAGSAALAGNSPASVAKRP